MRLITARSAGSRKSRGLGLPGWASAVTVPTSTNPNPRAGQKGIATPSLSSPAASPTGEGSFRPAREQASSGAGAPRETSAAARRGAAAEKPERQLVRRLGGQTKEERPDERVETHHA